MLRGRVLAASAMALTLACVVGGAPAQAKVERLERISTYDVKGERINEVMAALDRLGPPDDTGEHFHARTDARIDWTFAVHAIAGGCAVSSVRTKLALTVIMPHLVTDDAEVQQEFTDYTTRLMRHETGHVDNARKTAAEVDAAISALSPAATCKEMKDKANSTGHRVFDEGAARDVAYDKETDHGRLQGAHFP